MNEKKDEQTETDWQQIAQSITERSFERYEDLKAIWDLADSMLRFVDKKYPEVIYKESELHKAFFKAPSTDGFVSPDEFRKKKIKRKDVHYRINPGVLREFRFDEDTYVGSLVAAFYFGAIGLFDRIAIATSWYLRGSPESRYSRRDPMTYIKKLCQDGNVPEGFTQVVIHFRSLQKLCLKFIEVPAWNKKQSPADPRVRAKRASAGGKAKNFGEQIMKEMVLEFLQKQPLETIHESIPELCRELCKGLNPIWDEYREGLESPVEHGGLPLLYGMKQDPVFDFPRKLYEWKDDPEFRKVLERICIIRS
jgi:hypothetical protein